MVGWQPYWYFYLKYEALTNRREEWLQGVVIDRERLSLKAPAPEVGYIFLGIDGTWLFIGKPFAIVV